MIPMKEARIHLYKMYKDKYITYQEVPRRDHNPETTIFLWCINNPGENNAIVVSDVHKTIFNLRQRRAFEVAKHGALLVLDSERGAVAEEPEAARQFRFVLDHLDKACANACRMLRLFR